MAIRSAGCPLGETFNRLVANAFKMASPVRSALIAAEHGYALAGELLRAIYGFLGTSSREIVLFIGIRS